MTAIRITRAGPGATLQDLGRYGALQYGISASGPMDRGAFLRGGRALTTAGRTAIEFAQAGIDFVVEGGGVAAAFAGGDFTLRVDGRPQPWPAALDLARGAHVELTPGTAGNYGYVRFDLEIDLPPVLGSRATNVVAGLGGLDGRALRAGDILDLTGERGGAGGVPPAVLGSDDPVRFIWGIHADLFTPTARQAFLTGSFSISTRLDRMGVRLEDPGKVFGASPILSLVSDAIVPGDIQILGDGTPIVLMRDHQPTGGYPRIGTVISGDLDRFAQLRPGAVLAFRPVSLQKARQISTASRA
jgi:biotin-dependent carboxylase-like uncharacterized protein